MSKIKLTKIAYEPHPVSPERKRELNAKGYRILDIRLKPANAPAEKMESSENTASQDELAAVRKEYEAVVGRRPFHGWDADELRKRMAAAYRGD